MLGVIVRYRSRVQDIISLRMVGMNFGQILSSMNWLTGADIRQVKAAKSKQQATKSKLYQQHLRTACNSSCILIHHLLLHPSFAKEAYKFNTADDIK